MPCWEDPSHLILSRTLSVTQPHGAPGKPHPAVPAVAEHPNSLSTFPKACCLHTTRTFMRAVQAWALAILPHCLLGQLPSSSDSSSLGLGALVHQEHQAAQQQQWCQHNTDSMDLGGAKLRNIAPAQPPSI